MNTERQDCEEAVGSGRAQQLPELLFPQQQCRCVSLYAVTSARTNENQEVASASVQWQSKFCHLKQHVYFMTYCIFRFWLLKRFWSVGSGKCTVIFFFFLEDQSGFILHFYYCHLPWKYSNQQCISQSLKTYSLVYPVCSTRPQAHWFPWLSDQPPPQRLLSLVLKHIFILWRLFRDTCVELSFVVCHKLIGMFLVITFFIV